MRYHLVWFWWASAFLVPWTILFRANPGHRRVMWRASLVTALFGVTEPIGIPLEELLFGLTFGMYWSGVYEHVTWTRALRQAGSAWTPNQPLTGQGS